MTGLIYVAIIAVWAVVLVPAWLRRHDHLDPERSVDRFTRSMQTLASRPSVLGIPMPTHEAPEAPDQPETEIVRPRRGLRRRARVSAESPRQQRSASRRHRRRISAPVRRRIVLTLLVAALLVVAGLVVAGVLLPVALAVPGILIVGFLVLARHQVRAARRARRRSADAAAARAATTSAATPASTATTAAGSTWEARATPLPTYVTAPPADGYPRAIDQVPGAWTAAAMLQRAQKQKDRAERMAAAKAEAIARARAEQDAAVAPSRDEAFLAAQAVPSIHDTVPLRRVRAVNE